LEERLALCEMLRRAQEGGSFYARVEDHACGAGPFVLGHEAADPVFESGRIGPELGVFGAAEANRRVYADLPRVPEGVAQYVVFARVDELTFEPDVVVVTARPSQAEVITRAHGYGSGVYWETRATTIIGCAYLLAYPYLTGKMNILVTGLHHGMRARGVFPEGLLLVSIPGTLAPEILGSLAAMAAAGRLDLPQYHWGKAAHEEHMRGLVARLGKDLG
jgi:uncharacterized protein (DUF169 family)